MAIVTSNGTVNIHDLINMVLLKLFAHEMKRHQDCIDSLSRRNSQTTHILHGGETFKVSWSASGRAGLDEVLWPDMEKFLLDRNAVSQDSKVFWQSLFSLLEPCESMQDARDALPDFLVELAPPLSPWLRVRPEAWTVIGNPRTHRQYLKIREKMEFYSLVQKNPTLTSLMCFYNFEV